MVDNVEFVLLLLNFVPGTNTVNRTSITIVVLEKLKILVVLMLNLAFTKYTKEQKVKMESSN